MTKTTKAMTGGLNLGDAKAVADREAEGQVTELVDSAGEPLVYFDGAEEKPVWVRVAGSYSAVYRKAVERQRLRMMKRRRGKLSAKEVTENQVELEAACVLEWGGVLTDDGQAIDCNPENVARFLADVAWFREQVQIAMEDHASFFKSA